jgi:hypothetical protein
MVLNFVKLAHPKKKIIFAPQKPIPWALQTPHKLLLRIYNFWWLFSSITAEIGD